MGTAPRGGFALEKESVRILLEAVERLEQGFSDLPAVETAAAPREPMREILLEAAERLTENYPFFHPLYAGQMLKPPHPVARAAYALAMWVNPNNHALDSSRASSKMEKEAIAEIARMFGWDSCLGHLCGGGTMANLEALWVAGRVSPGKTVVASDQAHYTHGRISAVLGLPFETVACDAAGRMDPAALAARLDRGGVGTVVATLGTTATGSVDPLPAILELRARHGFRLHADAAYGGYFELAGNLAAPARAAYDGAGEADSIVVDPHKHGLQPYGCGAVLFRDPSAGRFYKHDSPYTYFTSKELHLGEISLECSRAGASAVALWATQRMMPLVPQGVFAKALEAGREAALELSRRLSADPRFLTPFPPELDIVVWTPRAESASRSSELARKVFEAAADRGLHLALAELPALFFDLPARGISQDRDRITCLRSVLMKPEHRDWLPRIWEILDEAAHVVLKAPTATGATSR
ncbi:MAG TPA: aminotransferase class I/II-fold pyridoxal phosphate-dependent enzyme [Thermoanaerobaculia bacterium]|nr:aminotransferase class I/II-fold pyridoxal phosphate-dependent enzyme [Thermoanaerobaculia bacterium]